jgi:dihydrolipoamide dehydrogenase
VRVKIGDKVGEGSLILTLETGSRMPLRPHLPLRNAAAPGAPMPMAARHVGEADHECDMLVLGAGPGGYSAAFAPPISHDHVLVERYPTLGGVCLNVGCIPSKALLHTASVIDEVKQMAPTGSVIPRRDRPRQAAHPQGEGRRQLTGGLAGMAKARRVTVLEGVGKFLDPHHLEVAAKNGGGRKVVKFDKSIIAAGSEAIKLPFIPDDPRVIDSTGALELRQMPKSMLVIGGGIIGLEMATVYSTLGTRIDVVEMLDGLMTGADRDLVKVWEKKNAGRFDKVMLKTKTVSAAATTDGISIGFEGEKAPAQPQRYDMVLVAVGRSPNGKKIDADKAGVAVSDRGFIQVDKQMRTNMPHIFAIGDIVGQPMLAHKAVHEAHVAAETAAGKNSVFEARQIPRLPIPTRKSHGRVSRRTSASTGNQMGRRFSLGCFRPRHCQWPRRGFTKPCSTSPTIACSAAASSAPMPET